MTLAASAPGRDDEQPGEPQASACEPHREPARQHGRQEHRSDRLGEARASDLRAGNAGTREMRRDERLATLIRQRCQDDRPPVPERRSEGKRVAGAVRERVGRGELLVRPLLDAVVESGREDVQAVD